MVDSSVAATGLRPQAANERLKWSTIFIYGAPGTGVGLMYLLMALYVMKYSTDVLLISPAIMGTIFLASRVFDAITDPLAGYYSDRTRHPLGRRRLWMLISIVPVGVIFLMVFAPPEGLSNGWLGAWMAVAIIGFYAILTVFNVPHLALGAEITSNYHERSRLFGLRHAAFTFGSILAVISMVLLIDAERQGKEVVRDVSFWLAFGVGIITAVLIALAVIRLRERVEFQGRGAKNPYKAFKDVWDNVHARLIIIVSFIETIGSASIGLLTLYVAQYVVGRYELGPMFIMLYMIPSAFSVPLWIPLSRKVGKKHLWICSMLATGLAFGGMFALPFIDSEIARIWLISVLAVFAGLAAGCGGTISPSIQGDVIDYDEYITGERKEGAYFAVWNFVYKSTAGVMGGLTGWMLAQSGFVPGAEQTMTVKVSMVALYGLFPLVCYIIGAILFSRFTLNEREHSEIREALEARGRAEQDTL